MKALFFLFGAVALAAACDRRPGPGEASARAVTGVLEVRLGATAAAQRFNLRVDHTAGGFLSALRPISGSGGLGPLGAGLALVPFVREGGGPAGPVAIETPAGTGHARFTDPTLAPWRVVARARLL